MQKKTIRIAFHNPNPPEKTVQFLVRMLARAAVEQRKAGDKGAVS